MVLFLLLLVVFAGSWLALKRIGRHDSLARAPEAAPDATAARLARERVEADAIVASREKAAGDRPARRGPVPLAPPDEPRAGELFSIDYADVAGAVTSRQISLRGYRYDGRLDELHLVAYCHLEKREREFAVDRINKAKRADGSGIRHPYVFFFRRFELAEPDARL